MFKMSKKKILLLGILMLSSFQLQVQEVKKPVFIKKEKVNFGAVSLLTQQNKVKKPVIELLKLYGINQSNDPIEIDKEIEKKQSEGGFLRDPGVERTDLKDPKLLEKFLKVRMEKNPKFHPDISEKGIKKLSNRTLKLLKEQGFVRSIPHFKVDVDYYLLFGAFSFRVIERFQDFIVQWDKNKIKTKNIVFLGGVRKLRADEIDFLKDDMKTLKFKKDFDLAAFLKKLGKKKEDLTEADMMRLVWESAILPQSLRDNFLENKNLFFVNSHDTNSPYNRPTTDTTVKEWIATFNPKPGSCHMNVEKPYGVRMQKAALCYLTPLGFAVTMNSNSADPDLPILVYIDELARTLNQDLKLRNLIA